MRNPSNDHRPVTEQSQLPQQIAWLGAAEAARQQALLRVGGQANEDLIRQERRGGDRRIA